MSVAIIIKGWRKYVAENRGQLNDFVLQNSNGS